VLKEDMTIPFGNARFREPLALTRPAGLISQHV
jgi:hypothetical protein